MLAAWTSYGASMSARAFPLSELVDNGVGHSASLIRAAGPGEPAVAQFGQRMSMTTRDIVSRLIDLGRLATLLRAEWSVIDFHGNNVEMDGDNLAALIPELVDAEIDRLTEELQQRTGEVG